MEPAFIEQEVSSTGEWKSFLEQCGTVLHLVVQLTDSIPLQTDFTL